MTHRSWPGWAVFLIGLGSLIVGTTWSIRDTPPVVYGGGRKISTKAAAVSKRQRQPQVQNTLDSWSLLWSNELRGGAEDVNDEVWSDDDDAAAATTTTTTKSTTTSLLLNKLRNIIRSVLQIGDRKVPKVSKTLKSILRSIESILGIDLLPKTATTEKTTKKKKQKKKQKNKKTTKTSDLKDNNPDDDEGDKEIASTTATAAKTTKNPVIKKHLATKMLTNNPNFRIQKELKEFILDPPPNLSVKVGKNIRVWIVTMEGAKNTVYEGEVFKLRISFPQTYPTMPPSVYFLPPNIP